MLSTPQPPSANRRTLAEPFLEKRPPLPFGDEGDKTRSGLCRGERYHIAQRGQKGSPLSAQVENTRPRDRGSMSFSGLGTCITSLLDGPPSCSEADSPRPTILSQRSSASPYSHQSAAKSSPLSRRLSWSSRSSTPPLAGLSPLSLGVTPFIPLSFFLRPRQKCHPASLPQFLGRNFAVFAQRVTQQGLFRGERSTGNLLWQKDREA